MTSFSVNSKDLFDPKKNLGLKLSPKSILANPNIPKKPIGFVAWYCHKCKLYFREAELIKGKCPECQGFVIPEPMEAKE